MRQQLTGAAKFLDTLLFNRAEQKQIDKENAEEKLEFVKTYDGPMESYANDQSYIGPCDLCGGTAAGNLSELKHPEFGWIHICAQCSERKAKDPGQLAWNRKQPFRI